MLPRRQERGRRLLKRSRGRLPSRAEEGDGADTWARAVSGCGREDDAAAVARVKLGWRGLLGRARHAAGGWCWAERGAREEASWAAGRKRPAEGRPTGRNEEGRGENEFCIFFFFHMDFQKHF